MYFNRVNQTEILKLVMLDALQNFRYDPGWAQTW